MQKKCLSCILIMIISMHSAMFSLEKKFFSKLDEKKIEELIYVAIKDKTINKRNGKIHTCFTHAFKVNQSVYIPIIFSPKSELYGYERDLKIDVLEFCQAKVSPNGWKVSTSYTPKKADYSFWGLEAVGYRILPTLGPRLLVVYKAMLVSDYELAPAVFSFDRKGDCVYDEASTQVVAAAKCKQWTISAMNKILKDKNNKK